MAAEDSNSVVVCDVSMGTSALVLSMSIPHVGPNTVFACWTDPARVCCWWPAKAEIEPKLGGRYHLAWPAHGWHLRGHYTAFVPGERLQFTWTWDHDAAVTKTVEMTLTSREDGGTTLTVTHGPYTESDRDCELRESHLAGWQHFLPRLHAFASRERAP